MGKGQAKILLPYPKEIMPTRYNGGILFEREVLRGWRKFKTLCKLLKRSNMAYSVKFLPRLVLPKIFIGYGDIEARFKEVKKREGLTAVVKWKEKEKNE